MNNDIEILKIRRFALIFGIILLTYLLAGVELITPAKITPFGIPLLIKSPIVILFVIFFGSVYGTARFIYFYVVCEVNTPIKARKNLIDGKLANGSQSAQTQGAFIDKAIVDINRYFPTVKSDMTDKIIASALLTDSSRFRIKGLHITKKMKIIGYIRDVDYYSPIWFNSIVLLIFIIKLTMMYFEKSS